MGPPTLPVARSPDRSGRLGGQKCVLRRYMQIRPIERLVVIVVVITIVVIGKVEIIENFTLH